MSLVEVRELEEDITIGVQLGNITFSFKTDREGSNVKTTVKAIKEMTSTHAQLFKSLRPNSFGKSAVVPELSIQSQVGRKGRAETSLVLGKLEEVLMPRSYFKTARTTGDVKAELEKQTGVPFTSRKVSQALGVLFKKKMLARVGSKGSFRYIQL
jgi:hypothetical protein